MTHVRDLAAKHGTTGKEPLSKGWSRATTVRVGAFAWCLLGGWAGAWGDGVESAARAPFPNFESGPIAALKLSSDGQHLYALNTPDHRLEVWAVEPRNTGPRGGASTDRRGTLRYVGSVFTGLEPVAILEHPERPHRLFVANHVSDTVSVVDVRTLEVVESLDVGDEPQGLAIAGGRLFVACARAPDVPRGPGDAVSAPVRHHQVHVRSADEPFDFVGLVPIQAGKPRDLVAQQGVVYVVPQVSGNRTTILNEDATAAAGLEQLTPDSFNPVIDVNPILTKRIFNTGAFGRGWKIPFAGRIVFDDEYPDVLPTLPDHDVTAIDAASLAVLPTPTRGVGTTLFDAEWNAWTGDLWITNTDADNRVRFEPTLKGRAVRNRITVVEPGASVRAVWSLDAPDVPQSYAQPASLVLGREDDPRAFVASLGTARVVVLDARDGEWLEEIETAGIPSALAYDEARRVLYVLCRGDHAIHAYDVAGVARLLSVTPLAYDPEPRSVRRGREHLYSASADTGHGNGVMSCATCHVFGHTDGLAWDLGDPEGSYAYYYPDIMTGENGFDGFVVADYFTPLAHPLKGPMTTQSFRGLLDPSGPDDVPLHWRGDRRILHQFQGAFEGLLGGDGLDARRVQEFTTFVRSLTYAPNPYQPRDDVYRGDADLGRDTYGMNAQFAGKEYHVGTGLSCIVCHKGNFFDDSNHTGSRPTVSHGSFSQIFNTAQLRNNYEKDFRDLLGFGALHDGAVDGVRGFMDFVKPRIGDPVFPNFDDDDKDRVAEFVQQWDHGLSPLVGAQWTVDASNHLDGWAFLALAEPQAQAGSVDLILKGRRRAADGTWASRGAFYGLHSEEWAFQVDTGDVVDVATVMLLARTGAARWTFTAVPPGLGERLGIDRDEDGLFDAQEVFAGTDATHPDHDRDGHTDGAEIMAGSDPRDASQRPSDTTAPTGLDAFVAECSAQSATWSGRYDEPVELVLTLGRSAGASDLGTRTVPRLRARHDVMLTGLPAATSVHWTATASDAAGNTFQQVGSFETFARLLHVADLTLELEGAGPFTATARLRVRDERGAAVVGVPMTVFWDGELGAQNWVQEGVTDGLGWATFQLQPFAAPSGSTVAISPGWLGSVDPASPWFVGVGGTDVAAYYDQTANRVHYRAVVVP